MGKNGNGTNGRKHDIDDILEAVRGHGRYRDPETGRNQSSFGNMSVIATRLAVTRSTVYNYKNGLKTVEKAILEEREVLKDFAESQIARRIADGSDRMIEFYAKTQMRDRGYIQRQDIALAGVVDNMETLDDDERKRRIGAILDEVGFPAESGDDTDGATE